MSKKKNKRARLNVIRQQMGRVDCPAKVEHLVQPDPEAISDCAERHVESGVIAQ